MEPTEFSELNKKIAELEALRQKAEELAAELRQEGIAQVQKVITALSIQPQELCFNSEGEMASAEKPVRARRGESKLPPKYRGPNGRTWSGRGRRPSWIQAIIDKDGEDALEAYLIERPELP